MYIEYDADRFFDIVVYYLHTGNAPFDTYSVDGNLISVGSYAMS